MAFDFFMTCMDVAYYFFGYIFAFGEYVMQPTSVLSDGFLTSFPLFSGGVKSVTFLPVGGVLGDFISWVVNNIVGEVPLIVAIIVATLTFGLIVKAIKSIL